MTRLNILLTAVLLTITMTVRAQYDVNFSHYYDMETSFNPAAAGKESKLNVTVAYAMDLAGFEHNPQTAYASGDMPVRFLNCIHGLGLQFMNDKLGLFNHMRLSLQYANKQRLFGGTMSIGIQGGLLSEKWSGSGLDVEDPSDPVLSSSDISGHALDLSAGLYYTHGSWYAGISALHLTAPKVRIGDKNELKIDPSYWATLGYSVQLRNPLLSLKFSALGRTDVTSWRADVTGRLVYQYDQKMFYGGVTYSPMTSVTVLLGGRFHGVVVGYSYEIYTSAINPGNGSHELFVGYQTDINLLKKGKNLHKSPRIL